MDESIQSGDAVPLNVSKTFDSKHIHIHNNTTHPIQIGWVEDGQDLTITINQHDRR